MKKEKFYDFIEQLLVFMVFAFFVGIGLYFTGWILQKGAEMIKLCN